MPWVLTDLLTAVDVHVHIEADGHGHYSLDDELMAASARYFRADHDRTPTLPQIAEMYRSLSMAAVVFTVDAGTATGRRFETSIRTRVCFAVAISVSPPLAPSSSRR